MPSTTGSTAERTARTTSTMSAAVLTGPRSVEVQHVPLPEPGPSQVRVRMEGCGVCASNVPVWEGRPWFDYPREPGSPGHEGWGVVDAVGAEVDALQLGDRVACLSYHAFAEYDLAEAAATVRLPDSLRDTPLPGEPLGCALNIFRRSDLRPGQKVAVVGVGFLGALLIQLAKYAGAEVFAVSRRRQALEIARRCGADHVLPLADAQQIAAEINRLTNDAGCERVIEAAGKQEALDLCSQLVAVRGRLVIAGFHQDGLRQVNMQLWNWRGIDVINAHERDPAMYVAGMQEAIRAVEEGRIDPFPLFTHAFPLNEIGRALQLASGRPNDFLKAYITFTS